MTGIARTAYVDDYTAPIVVEYQTVRIFSIPTVFILDSLCFLDLNHDFITDNDAYARLASTRSTGSL